MTSIPVERIAKLSNITLTHEEEMHIGSQLEKTVEYVKNLEELDTTSVQATASPSGNLNVFFDDVTDDGRKVPPGSYKVNRILT